MFSKQSSLLTDQRSMDGRHETMFKSNSQRFNEFNAKPDPPINYQGAFVEKDTQSQSSRQTQYSEHLREYISGMGSRVNLIFNKLTLNEETVIWQTVEEVNEGLTRANSMSNDDFKRKLTTITTGFNDIFAGATEGGGIDALKINKRRKKIERNA